jgi:predicted metal-dependent phosphoesterase TrpH
MIDLHTHSLYSDGTYTPQKIVKEADKKKLMAIALTDHDTIDGIEDFLSEQSNTLKVPGVEISIDYDRGTFHLVGLFISHKNKNIIDAMEELKNYRKDRNKKLIKNISNLINEEIDESDFFQGNKGELGRPHMAKFLVKKAVVNDVNEAFEKYLGKGKALYLPKKRYSFDKAVSLKKDAGGISVLAHPNTLNLNINELYPFIKNLKDNGLDAIECYYNSFYYDDVMYYKRIAEKYNLLISAGSDFHGDNKKDVQIATYPFEPENPEEILENMLKKIN